MSFRGIIKKLNDFCWRVLVIYQENKTKRLVRQPCDHCGVRQFFNLPIGDSVEMTEFICAKCNVPTRECKHPIRNREYYESGMFKCYSCGKILNSTIK